jgi:hypothetical protein
VTYYDWVTKAIKTGPYPATIPSGVTFYGDPVDSPDATECGWTNGLGIKNGWVVNAGDGANPETAASLAGILPPSNSLSYVMTTSKDEQIGFLRHTTVDDAPNMTLCFRHYMRFNPSMSLPPHDCGTGGHSQYKVSPNLGARMNGRIDGPMLQIGIGKEYSCDPPRVWNQGKMNGLSASVAFGINQGSGTAEFSNIGLGMAQECMNNFCRFEACVDYRQDGRVHTRFRKVVLPAGDGRGSPPKTYQGPANDAHWSAKALSHWKYDGGVGGTNFEPLQLYKQGILNGPYGPRWVSHVMVAKTRGMDQNFWIGPACEVEGGCSGGGGSAPPPEPPTGVRPAAPILLP